MSTVAYTSFTTLDQERNKSGAYLLVSVWKHPYYYQI